MFVENAHDCNQILSITNEKDNCKMKPVVKVALRILSNYRVCELLDDKFARWFSHPLLTFTVLYVTKS